MTCPVCGAEMTATRSGYVCVAYSTEHRVP